MIITKVLYLTEGRIMIELQKGNYPKFQADHVEMPFSDADVGKRFEFTGTVKLDSIAPEGPTFTFEVLEIEFPEKEQGTVKSRKAQRQIRTSGVTINVNLDSIEHRKPTRPMAT